MLHLHRLWVHSWKIEKIRRRKEKSFFFGLYGDKGGCGTEQSEAGTEGVIAFRFPASAASQWLCSRPATSGDLRLLLLLQLRPTPDSDTEAFVLGLQQADSKLTNLKMFFFPFFSPFFTPQNLACGPILFYEVAHPALTLASALLLHCVALQSIPGSDTHNAWHQARSELFWEFSGCRISFLRYWLWKSTIERFRMNKIIGFLPAVQDDFFCSNGTFGCSSLSDHWRKKPLCQHITNLYQFLFLCSFVLLPAVK